MLVLVLEGLRTQAVVALLFLLWSLAELLR